MKKLMTMIAAVGMAFGLFADGLYTQPDGFEGSWAVTGNWSTNGEATVTQGDWGGYTRQDTTTLPYGFTTVGDSYLTVKTPIKVNEGLAWANADTVKTIGDGIYFDGLVNFTHCDSPVEVTADNGTKLVVYTVESEVEDSDVTKTNLYVSAGFKNGNAWEAKAYDCGSLDNFNAEQCDDTGFWRVTIRSIRDISEGADVNPGFLVFVNGVGANRGDQGIGLADLNGTANAWATKGNLFPSLVQDQMDQSALTAINAVAFAGQGSIDDVVITRNEPADFVKDEFFTITIGDANVASVTYKVGENAAQTFSSGSEVIPYVAGMSVTVSATYTPGDDPEYGRGKWMLDDQETNESVFTPSANQTLMVYSKDVTQRIQIGANYYTTFADAIAAIGTDPVVLKINKSNVNVGLNEEMTEAMFGADTDVTIDLAGNTITGLADIDGYVLMSNGKLTITDSSNAQTGKIVANANNAGVIGMFSPNASTAAALTILAGKFNGKVYVDAAEEGVMKPATASISGGSFAKASNTEGQTFSLAGKIADGFKLGASEGDYWEVIAIPAHKLTVTGVANATFKINGASVTEVDLKEGASYTVVATANENYEYKSDATYTDNWAYDEVNGTVTNIGVMGTANIALTVPAPTAEVWTISYNEGEVGDCIELSNETYTVETRQTQALWNGVRAGYTMDSAWVDAEGNDVEDVETYLADKTGNITLYATWMPEVTDATVTLSYSDTEIASVSATVGGTPATITDKKFTAAIGSAIVITATAQTGYENVTFKVDDAAAASTCEFTLEDDTSVTISATKKAEPVTPGEPITPDPGDTPTKINGDDTLKGKYLKAPGGITTTKDYRDLFNAVDAGEGQIKFELNDAGKAAVAEKEQAADTQVLTAALDTAKTAVTVENPLVGFYYSLKQDAALKSLKFTDKNKLGGGVDAITFNLLRGTNSGFYQMVVTPARVD